MSQRAKDVLEELIYGEKQVVRKVNNSFDNISDLGDISALKPEAADPHQPGERDHIHVSYIISGVIEEQVLEAPSATNQSSFNSSDDGLTSTQSDDFQTIAVQSVILVPQEDLEETKAQFKSISSLYVYSVGPAKSTDITGLTNAQLQCQVLTRQSSAKELWDSGIIRNPLIPEDFQFNVIKEQISGPAHTKEIKPKSSSKPIEKTEVEKKVSSKSFFGSKSKDAKGKSHDIKKLALPKAAVSEIPPALSAPAPSAPTPEIPSTNALKSAFENSLKPKEPVERVIIGDNDVDMDDLDEDLEESGPPKPNKDLENLFVDDIDMEENEVVLHVEGKSVAEPVSKLVEEKVIEQVSEHASKQTSEQASVPAPVPAPAQELPSGPRRGKRKVIKKITRKDDRGYLITTQQEVWESCSEDEAPPNKKPTIAPLAKIPSRKKGTEGQKSLLSFFKK